MLGREHVEQLGYVVVIVLLEQQTRPVDALVKGERSNVHGGLLES